MNYTVHYYDGDEKSKDFKTLDGAIVYCFYLYKNSAIDYAFIKSHYTATDFTMDNGFIKPLID